MSIPRNLGNFADNVNANGKVEVTGINATGTPSGSTALLGNGTWGTVTTSPAGSTGQVQYNNAGAFGALPDGTSGQVLTSAGAGSAPTWASPAASAGVVTAVASGALTAGVPVVINSDGTVSAISGSYGTTPTFTGNIAVTGSPSINNISPQGIVYDPVNQRIVAFYQNSSNYPTAVVGSISSGGAITWGTPNTFRSYGTSFLNAVYHAASGNIVVVFNYPNAGGGFSCVGTVSGLTISFGSDAVFEPNSGAYYNAIAYDSSTQKVVVAWRAIASNDYGYAAVGTVSGTNISFGARVAFSASQTIYIGAAYDVASGKIVFGYRDNPSSQIRTIVGTVSGTTISFGSSNFVDTNAGSYVQVVYDNNAQKCVIVWANGNTSYGQSIVGTVSGTSMSFGSVTNFNTNLTAYISCAYHASAQKIAIAFKDSSNFGNVIVGTISGTTISFGTVGVFSNDSANYYFAITYDSINQYLPIFYGQTGGVIATGNVGILSLSTNLTTSNFLGISSATYSTGQTATINTVGSFNTSQSGLTAGTKYYASPIGGLSTTVGTFNAYAGLAVSATKLVVKG